MEITEKFSGSCAIYLASCMKPSSSLAVEDMCIMGMHGTLKAAYYDAYHAARQEINSGIAGMEVQGGFDARA